MSNAAEHPNIKISQFSNLTYSISVCSLSFSHSRPCSSTSIANLTCPGSIQASTHKHALGQGTLTAFNNDWHMHIKSLTNPVRVRWLSLFCRQSWHVAQAWEHWHLTCSSRCAEMACCVQEWLHLTFFPHTSVHLHANTTKNTRVTLGTDVTTMDARKKEIGNSKGLTN